MKPLVWFRSDLRTHDNTALHHACKSATGGVLALFIVSPDQWRGHDYAPARVDLILRTLRELSASLAGLNIPLLIETADRPGDIPAIVARIVSAHGCTAVHANREYELDEARRDELVTAALTVPLVLHHDQTALDPQSIRTGEGRYFSVFSPFRKAWLKRWAEVRSVRPLPAPRPQSPLALRSSPVPDAVPGFESSVPQDLWPGGEQHAQSRLQTFARAAIDQYKTQRDYPATHGSSRISPYLTVGAVSTRQCLAAAIAAASIDPESLDPKSFERLPPGPGQWISEVIWREFFTHVLVGYPRVCMNRAFQIHTDRIRWSDNRDHFDAWCAGRTGIPIVDAGMRELLATGWMHNRVRMITAMFLTKNLFVDWRWGERFFMRHLVDGFFASNNGGWQWSASTGTDAAPYFRIFNPVSQSRKFDEDGAYIRRWVPELAHLPASATHEPHAELAPLAAAKLDYPEPIVDLSKSRQSAIETFQSLKAR